MRSFFLFSYNINFSNLFIQIKNKDSIYTISAYKNDNCKRTKKKSSEIFCYVVENNFSFDQKNL